MDTLILGARIVATLERMKEIPLYVKRYSELQVAYKEVFIERKNQLM